MLDDSMKRYWELFTQYNQRKKLIYLDMIVRLPPGPPHLERRKDQARALYAAA